MSRANKQYYYIIFHYFFLNCGVQRAVVAIS